MTAANIAQGLLDSISIEYYVEPIEAGFIAFETIRHEETPVGIFQSQNRLTKWELV